MTLLLALAIMARVGTAAPQPVQSLFVRVGETVELLAPPEMRDPRWVLVAPIPKDYDNVTACGRHPPRGCHLTIEYRATELVSVRGRTSFLIADVPSLAAAGTHRLLATDGPVQTVTEAEFAQLPEVVVRRGDDYVGLLSEMFGVPFVLWPQRLEAGHQTDLRLGADCSALVVYGRRRLGEHVPYVSPRGLFQLARALKPNEPIHRGDVLDYGFQSAVLSVDTAPLGQLNPEDRVIQTYHGVAEELPIAALPYGTMPVQVLRWP